jgi:CRISPR system Cascade subunit CasA
MNLVEQLPFLCLDKNGNKRKIGFTEIVDPTLSDIWTSRPDLRGGAFQFMIGLLQTFCAPEDIEGWQDWWEEPPDAETLAACIANYTWAFEFHSERASFMQESGLAVVDAKDIAALLIESPGEKTIKDNLDFFIKRDQIQGMTPSTAALVLFTLQINAPGGGVGHRVSLRGGGPLTTLLVPRDPGASLWQKLWINILPKEEYGDAPIKQLSDVLPWAGAVRTSEAKTGKTTTPEDVHELQAYWSMPRRILFDHDDTVVGVCDISHEQSDGLLRSYRTQNYGVNYAGAWMHPLTPYTLDPKNDPLSIKGQRGGIGYKHWLGLTFGTDDKPKAALVVDHFQRKLKKKIPVRLWCFGYDMDNMKARCWYESTLPVYNVTPASQKTFVGAIKLMLDCATEGAVLLNKYVKAAQYKRPADVATNPSIAQSFWQRTEDDFYALAGKLSSVVQDEQAVAAIYADWLRVLRAKILVLFEEWVQQLSIEDTDMGRVVSARSELEKWTSAGKPFKALKNIVAAHNKKEAT